MKGTDGKLEVGRKGKPGIFFLSLVVAVSLSWPQLPPDKSSMLLASAGSLQPMDLSLLFVPPA